MARNARITDDGIGKVCVQLDDGYIRDNLKYSIERKDDYSIILTLTFSVASIEMNGVSCASIPQKTDGVGLDEDS